MMSVEARDTAICGEACPLMQLGDSDEAAAAREWAFDPPSEHEGFQDPRFPTLGMMAMHYGSLCRFRSLSGLCTQEVPDPAVE